MTSIDKLETLIDWAYGRGLLQPVPLDPLDDGEQDRVAGAPARVWVVGSAWRQLVGLSAVDQHCDIVGPGADFAELFSRALAPLIGRGWELSAGRNLEVSAGRGWRIGLARERGGQRVCVEVMVQLWPLAGDRCTGGQRRRG